MSEGVRRVVTGHDAEGKSIIVSDSGAPHVFRPEHRPGVAIHTLWAEDALPAAIGGPEETVHGQLGIEPPVGGCTFRVNEYPPEADWIDGIDREVARANFAQLGAAHAADESDDPPHPLMHKTKSVDLAIVLSGEIHMVLDDGETLLKTGDTVIQRGTNHAWSNRSDAPCRMMFVMLGGAVYHRP
jgi:mannose-6-phosphate isomerase-like protein (cupin superfamily)